MAADRTEPFADSGHDDVEVRAALRLVADEPEQGLPGPVSEGTRSLAFEDFLASARADGTHADHDVRVAAARLGVSVRTLYRYKAAGALPHGRGSTEPKLTEEILGLFYDRGGNVSAVHRELIRRANGEQVVSRRQLQRWYKDPERGPTAQERAFIKDGYAGRKDLILRKRRFGGHPDVLVGEEPPIEAQMDGHNLHVKARHPVTGAETDVVITTLVIARSSYWAGLHVGLVENEDSALFCMFDGMRRYGRPDLLQTDNGPWFGSNAVRAAAADVNVPMRRIEKRSAEKNGAVEALNGAIEMELRAEVARHKKRARNRDGDLYSEQGELLLPFEVIRRKVEEYRHRHNEQRIERLGGATPAEAEEKYERQPRPVRPEHLLFMLPSKSVPVTDEGIKLGERAPVGFPVAFFHDKLFDKVGETVTVHYAGSRPGSVWVVHDGEVLCEALHVDEVDVVDPEMNARKLGRQAGLDAKMRERMKASVERLAQDVAEQVSGLDETEPPAAGTAPRSLSSTSGIGERQGGTAASGQGGSRRQPRRRFEADEEQTAA